MSNLDYTVLCGWELFQWKHHICRQLISSFNNLKPCRCDSHFFVVESCGPQRWGPLSDVWWGLTVTNRWFFAGPQHEFIHCADWWWKTPVWLLENQGYVEIKDTKSLVLNMLAPTVIQHGNWQWKNPVLNNIQAVEILIDWLFLRTMFVCLQQIQHFPTKRNDFWWFRTLTRNIFFGWSADNLSGIYIYIFKNSIWHSIWHSISHMCWYIWYSICHAKGQTSWRWYVDMSPFFYWTPQFSFCSTPTSHVLSISSQRTMARCGDPRGV